MTWPFGDLPRNHYGALLTRNSDDSPSGPVGALIDLITGPQPE